MNNRHHADLAAEAKDLYARLKEDEREELIFMWAYVANHNSSRALERLDHVIKALMFLGGPAIGILGALVTDALLH